MAIDNVFPTLPAAGYLRQKQILGDPKAEPPMLPIFPVSPATWWKGIKQGLYPKPVKLGPNTTAWRVEDIRQLFTEIESAA